MDIIQALETRYSTKKFDSTKKISAEDMEKIEAMLQLSPSSTNAQPWHFIIASSEEGKARIAKGATGFYAFNEHKILHASAVILFASKVDVNEEYLLHVLSKEEEDGRFKDEETKNQQHGGRSYFAGMHKYDLKDQQHWAEKQAYINLGVLLTGLATLGIDAIPMEGVDMPLLNNEFDLKKQGLTTTCVVALGYRDETDFNAKLPKSRLDRSEIITKI